MSSSSTALPARLSEKRLTMIELDIQRSTRIAAELEDNRKVVMFFDGFYHLASHHVDAAGGEVVKYLGDAVLACFPEDQCVAAIDTVVAIREAFPTFCKDQGVSHGDIHGTVHIGDVVIGQFGPQGYKDILGHGTGTLFKLAGDGITISEQVYRKLPSSKRSPWRKRGGKVIYVLP